MHDSSTQTNIIHSLIHEITGSCEASNIQHCSKLSLDCSINDTEKSFNSSDLKLIKIIIYRLSEEIDIPDIMKAINDFIQYTIPFVTFIKKYKLKESYEYNYVFEIPHDIARCLIKLKCRNKNSLLSS